MTQLTKGIFTDRSAVLTGSAQLLAPADPNRQALLVHNPSAAQPMAFGFDSGVALNTGGYITLVQLAGGGNARPMLLQISVPTNDIWVIGTSGQGATVFTFP